VLGITLMDFRTRRAAEQPAVVGGVEVFFAQRVVTVPPRHKARGVCCDCLLGFQCLREIHGVAGLRLVEYIRHAGAPSPSALGGFARVASASYACTDASG